MVLEEKSVSSLLSHVLVPHQLGLLVYPEQPSPKLSVAAPSRSVHGGGGGEGDGGGGEGDGGGDDGDGSGGEGDGGGGDGDGGGGKGDDGGGDGDGGGGEGDGGGGDGGGIGTSSATSFLARFIGGGGASEGDGGGGNGDGGGGEGSYEPAASQPPSHDASISSSAVRHTPRVRPWWAVRGRRQQAARQELLVGLSWSVCRV